MISSNALNGLFKPYEVERKSIVDYFIKKVGERKFWKMQFEHECSKSIDETCINTECKYNYLNFHENELYVELRKEIDDYWLEVEKRNSKYLKEHGGAE